MKGARMKVEQAAGALGAFVDDVDLTVEVDDATVEGLREALDEHLVIFLRGKDMTLDDLERLTDQLGGRDVTPFVTPLADRPYVIRVIKEPEDTVNFANAWHTDLSYLPAPPSYTLLHAWETPASGGDTIWANQQRAFTTLSDGLRTTLRELRAVHSAGFAYGTGGYLDSVKGKSSMAIEPSEEAFRKHVHPLVTRHPRTGRPSLFVNGTYTTKIDGWTAGESAGLLGYLYRHAVNENFTCRVRWEPKMLAIWDNRATQHFAVNDYPGQRREMYRTSVKGAPPEAY
jgi:taurine dioxygenase